MADSPPVPPPQWAPVVPPMRPRRRWPVYASLALALVAVGLVAGVAIGVQLRRSGSDNSPVAVPRYTDGQVASAKTNVCAAFEKVREAVSVNTNRSGGGDDPTAILVAATSARQSLDFGTVYLLTQLAQEPAVPADLAHAIRELANSYTELTLGYLDGLTHSDPAVARALADTDDATLRIARLCE